jgi:hypothetical protein
MARRHTDRDHVNRRYAQQVSVARMAAREARQPATLTTGEWRTACEHWAGCAYCGTAPTRKPLYIDRAWPHLGVTVRNCVPICGRCRHVKGEASLDVAILHRALFARDRLLAIRAWLQERS